MMSSSEKLISFNVGQKAVDPFHGLGTIEKIESCNVGGSAQEFYVLKIHATGVKVMVPTSTTKNTGLRDVISGQEIEKIYEILRSPSRRSTATWNRRFRALNDKLNTGSLLEAAEVLRDLSSLKHDKDLSFGEKRMLEKARFMIVSEICESRSQDKSSVEVELNRFLSPAIVN